MLLIMTIGLGSIYPAIDITAGEKERGTLETILTLPVKTNELFLGKYITVSALAIGTGMLNLLSVFLVYKLQTYQMEKLLGISSDSFGIVTLLLLILLIIPMGFFISSLVISACLFAKSFKEAQNIITPVYLLLMVPTFMSVMPNVILDNKTMFVPILNVCLAIKGILVNDFTMFTIFIIVISNIIFALVGFAFILKLVNIEDVLFSNNEGFKIFTKRSLIIKKDVFEIFETLVIGAIIMILMIYIGSIFQLNDMFVGIIKTQWLIIFLPIVFCIWYFKRNFKKVLYLKHKEFDFAKLLAVVMITIGGIIAANLQSIFLDSNVNMESVNSKIIGSSGMDFLLIFFALVITPAVCEEVLFRGLILSSLLNKYTPFVSITVSAILFGLFHMDVNRFLPTLILGVVFGFIVYKSKSIYLSIIAHIINNGLSVILLMKPDLTNAVGRFFTTGNIASLISIAVVLIIFGSFSLSYFYSRDKQKNNCAFFKISKYN